MDTQGARHGRQQATAVQPDRGRLVTPTVADRAGGARHQRGDLLDTLLVRGAHRDGQRRDRTAHQRWSTCRGNDR